MRPCRVDAGGGGGGTRVSSRSAGCDPGVIGRGDAWVIVGIDAWVVVRIGVGIDAWLTAAPDVRVDTRLYAGSGAHSGIDDGERR